MMEKNFQMVGSNIIPNPASFQELKMLPMIVTEPLLGLQEKLDSPLPEESESLEHGTFCSTSSDMQDAQFPDTSPENEVLDPHGRYPFVSLFACADVNVKVENENVSAAEIRQPVVDMAAFTELTLKRHQLILENKEKRIQERLQRKMEIHPTSFYEEIAEENLILLSNYGINYEDCPTPMQIVAKKNQKVAKMFPQVIVPVQQDEMEQNVDNVNEMIDLEAEAATSNENYSADKSVKESDTSLLDVPGFTQRIVPDKKPAFNKRTGKRRKIDHSVNECMAVEGTMPSFVQTANSNMVAVNLYEQISKNGRNNKPGTVMIVPVSQTSLPPIQGIAKNDNQSWATRTRSGSRKVNKQL